MISTNELREKYLEFLDVPPVDNINRRKSLMDKI